MARVVHGTTLATNVILERRVARSRSLSPRGSPTCCASDARRGSRKTATTSFFTTPPPPVEPRLTFEVSERVNSERRDPCPLDAADVEELARRVAASRPTTPSRSASCNAYAEPDHERASAEACVPRCPTRSSVDLVGGLARAARVRARHDHGDVRVRRPGDGRLPQWARIQRLGSSASRCPLEIMDSGGGVMSAAMAARRPVRTLESGRRGRRHRGRAASSGSSARPRSSPSTWAARRPRPASSRDGKPAVTHDFQVGGKGSFGGTRAGTGVPVKIPAVDLAEVGAGGGSIAWVDAGGALRVGPRSAGSMPGPACYGRGGTEPTVTDANLVLGYLDPSGSPAASRSRSTRPRRRSSGSPSRWASTWSRPRAAIHDIATRSWRPRSGSSPCSAASTPATSRSSPSAAPARCMRSACRRCSGSARSRCRSPPASPRRSGSSAPTSVSSCADPHRRPRGRGRVGDRGRVRGAHRAGPCGAGRRAGRRSWSPVPPTCATAARRTTSPCRSPTARSPPPTWSSSTPRSATSTTRRTASRSSTPRRSTTCGCT